MTTIWTSPNSVPVGPRPVRVRPRQVQSMRGHHSGWLTLLCATLLGYILFGKGWAYLGVPPFLYVGEITLLLGLFAALRWGHLEGLTGSIPMLAWGVLAIWGTVRTVPYLSQYGADALRDAVLWGYGIFAVLIYAHLRRYPEDIATLIRRYETFCTIAMGTIPLLWVSSFIFEPWIPKWPWADVPVIHVKGGDLLVHLAGILAFWVCGLTDKVSYLRMACLAGSIAAIGAYNRGGLLACSTVVLLCLALRPSHRILWRMIAAGAVVVLLLAATDLRVSVPGKQRDVSLNQMLRNIGSIFQDDDTGLTATKEWRLSWWGDICNYTLNGPYFWSGKGFGINLADDDGYQGTAWEGKLRSPHNGHLTMLARGGVPAFALWLVIQITWGASVFGAYLRSTWAGQRRWSSWFMFLLLYWVAFIVNGSFDVFLESPMGGIWFWTLIGVGVVSIRLHLVLPQALADVPRSARRRSVTR